MEMKGILKEILIMGCLLLILIVLGVAMFYKYIPKIVDEPETSVYIRADKIEEALEEIEEDSTDTSILNTYTGETIYTRTHDHGKVNPFDRAQNELYDVTTGGTTSTQGNTTTSSSSGGTTSGNTSSGGKLTNTTGK